MYFLLENNHFHYPLVTNRRVCRERSTLVAVGETLVREVARLREDLDARTAHLSKLRETQADTEIPKILEVIVFRLVIRVQ